jgi:DedD protein
LGYNSRCPRLAAQLAQTSSHPAGPPPDPSQSCLRAAIDPVVIEVDAQLKYRLTGAVILVLLAVLFVPELLTGPQPSRPGGAPEPASTTTDGAPLRSYDIDLSDPVPVSPDAGEARAAPPSPTLAAPAPAVVEAPKAAATGPTTSPPPGTGASRPGVAPKAAGAAASSAGSSGFAVQVGSFSSRQSADRLAGELRGRRFDAFVSPVRSAGRQMFRVRVGPVADRAAAQALAARLQASGRSGTVVSLP